MNKTQQISVIFLVSAAFLLFSSIVNDYHKNMRRKTNDVYNIGLLVMATGKYSDFVGPLIESADKHFCTRHKVTYFIFTDGKIPQGERIVRVHQAQMGWPYDTMMRFHTYYKHKDLFKGYDYVFACDADMLFVDTVGDEILFDRVATIQPNYLFDSNKPYETNPFSTACVNRGEGKFYFAGAFYGGVLDEFLKLIHTAQNNIDIDLSRGYIAAVNDESHLNRYFIDHKPTVILSPSYCHFEHWNSPYPKKIVALDRRDGLKRSIRKKACSPLEYYKRFLREELRREHVCTQ